MQHIKLTIPGSFWDTQLYAGTLYVFDNLGDIFAVNWNSFIANQFESLADLQTAIHVSFLESDLFYTSSSQKLLRDSEIKDIVANRFRQLAQYALTAELTGANVAHSANPLPFPHADSEVYYRKLYVGLRDGVYSVCCSRRLSAQSQKRIWDAPVLDISASDSYTSIAIATGNDGLYEVTPSDDDNIPTPRLVTSSHCSSSEWSGQNIITSSYTSPAYIAEFKKKKIPSNKKKSVRSFDKTIELSTIFGGTGYSWGSHDKLYMHRNGIIDCFRYSLNREGASSFQPLGGISLANWKGKIVSANVAAFGTIIECDNAIIVAKSNGEIITLHGEPVNWRIFPNSKYYKNQMHVIYDDRLEIYSFCHDYFVDQPNKNAGIAIKPYKY
jgi:hypothetical protein